MLSDEEKKAIEVLQYVKNKTPFIFWYEDKPYNRKETINTILNLIKKQSKEIEELKAINKMQEYRINEMDIPKSVAEQRERKAYIKGTNDADELCNKKWEDKIKAKTIEIKNRQVKDEFITASQGKLNTIIDMESLLEKE